MSNISLQQLQHAVAIRERIETLERELMEILGGSVPTLRNGQGQRRTLSPAARAKIAAAQRKRWAKQKGSASVSSAPARKGRRTMSPAARAKIAAAARARWARAKAANRNSLAAF